MCLHKLQKNGKENGDIMKMRIKRAVAVLIVLSFQAFLFACGGGDGGASATSDAVSGAAGIFTINTSGADGGPEGGSGGNGGYVEIEMYWGSMGPLQVLASGAADASFTPTASTPNLGDNPLAITADTTIEVLDPLVPTDEPADGTPYMVASTPTVFIWNSGGTWNTQAGRTTVTGISVAAGATLTLELNYTTYAWVSLSNDIDNHGTITTDDNGALRGDLRLDLASYHGNSTIDTSGTLDGQSGGYVEIYPSYSFFNNGTIDTSGADSTGGAAGDGGYVQIYASYGIENTGNITTDGGAGSGAGATGGSAGYLDWQADLSLYNSGNLNCRGGAGVSAGGDGNGINLVAGNNYPADLHNSGDLDTSGGDATDGDGGSVTLPFLGSYGPYTIGMYTYGGDIVNSGNLTTKGGDTTDSSSDGGSGGSIYLEVYYQSSFSGYAGDDDPPGDVLFSGNVDASGGLAVTEAGATGSGGSGGNFWIYADYEYYPLGQRVALLGYNSIDTSGGAGYYGGTGGDVDLFCDYGYDYGKDLYLAGCNLTNEVNISATGGSVVATATEGYGGPGGSVNMETDYDYGPYYPDMDKLTNSGNIDTSSGNNLESDNYESAGSIWMWGYNGVTNSGNITARGGHDLGTDGGTTGYGNDGNDLQLYAELGPVSNSGDLGTDGGDGEYTGGYAYTIELFGPEVSNSGALTANGGDADPLLTGSSGGDGGYVELFSPNGMQGISQTGTVSNHGGTGETPGPDGDYYLGGQLL
jgi:hypothetical protein